MRRERWSAALRYGLVLLFLVAAALLDGSAALWALVAFALLLPPVSLGACCLVKKKLRAQLVLPTTAAKGSACVGRLRLTNRTWLPLPRVRCRLRLVNDLTQEEQTLFLDASLAPRRCTEREFLLESRHCGRIYAQLTAITLFDYAGLLSTTLSCRAGARMTVLPALFPCELSLSPAADDEAERTLPQRGADVTEVFQLREYQPGDDVRRIHWKLSSKVDGLLLREPGQSVSRSVLLFWDKRPPCLPAQMDAMAEAAASLCLALCDSGISFELCWTGADELETRRIHDRDALLPVIPELVKSAGSAGCPLPELAGCGRVLYLAARRPEQAHAENVTLLLCAGEEADDCICFTPDTVESTFKRLEL